MPDELDFTACWRRNFIPPTVAVFRERDRVPDRWPVPKD
jgi:hypothetical protein